METLAQKYPDAVASLKARGYINLAKMCGQYVRGADMARALGMFPSSSSVSRWMTGRAMPKWGHEQTAKEWIKAQACGQWQFDYATPGPLEVAVQAAPVATKPASDMLVVVTPKDKQEKVIRVLEMMGCEVVVL